ncbi:hypothetical protein ACWF9G_22860 [Nocardia sp. NPDC055029]
MVSGPTLGVGPASARISYTKLAGHEGVTAAGNTIHGWIQGKNFPQWANLAPVLHVWGITDGELGK